MNPTRAEEREAWGTFWERNSGAGGPGCLPERLASIEQAQHAAWARFAADIPANARVGDLATGDGVVMAWIARERSDLELVGIDLAPTLPPAPSGTTTQGGVAMEDLPFADASMGAITSQFGFEYGDTDAVAAEIARVLAPGGRVGLMVHRGDGPILAYNRERQVAIGRVLDEEALIERTNVILADGEFATARSRALALATQSADAAKERFGEASPGWQIAEAVRRTVALGERAGPRYISDTLAVIEDQARNELGRIASLARACKTADDRDAIEAAFAKNGIALRSTEPASEPSGRAFADFLTLSGG